MKNRILNVLALIIVPFLLYPTRVKAAGFSLDEALSYAQQYTDPMSNFLMIMAPSVAVISTGVSLVTWMLKDEDERERSPFTKKVKNIVIACVIFFSIGVILKIFGVSSDAVTTG